MSPERIFDQWTNLYAKRTASMRSSEIRDLLNVATRPDIISFAGGLPYTKVFSKKQVIRATKEVIDHHIEAALQYGASEGHEGLKRHVVEFLQAENIKVDTEDILITDGAQQALDLIGKVFLNPRDQIIVEAPSYVGALTAFTGYEAQFLTVPMDDDGIKTGILRNQLEKLKTKPKILYTIPNFHNPAGITLSSERRKELLKIKSDYDLLLVEDNAYSMLRFEGKPLPALRSIDNSIIYLGTFSKIFFNPGVRLGWVIAPHAILEKLIFAKQAANLCSSSLSQRLVEEFLNKNSWREHVQKMVEIYREKRDAMLEALEELFPEESRWTKPEGGFYIWVTFPEFVDTTKMLAEAISKKVAYVPGRAFFPDKSGKNYLRLAFCNPEKEEIYQGIKRLSGVIKDRIELYKSFGKF